MSTPNDPSGRPRGGLSRITDRLHLLRFLRAHQSGVRRLAWNAAGGVVGGAIGLGMVTLWLSNR
ncbi:hypothetical protein ACIO1C_29460 [Streptomyces sp. NPDC087420]|uniref:hypothetical protein n=1 Tax=Streptomyces sp. NPDC087420 TaxID=3365785 RepID=UPI003835B940